MKKQMDTPLENYENDVKGKMDEIEKQLAIEERKYHTLTSELKALEQELLAVRSRYNFEKGEVEEYRKKLSEVVNSNSWRLSYPIRKSGEIVKRIKNGKRQPNTKTPTKSKKSNNTNVELESRKLEKKLWGGYSSYALEELKALRDSNKASINERINAANSIARWYFDQNEIKKAYEQFDFIHSIYNPVTPHLGNTIREIKVLKKLGEVEFAKRKVWEAIRRRGLHPICV